MNSLKKLRERRKREKIAFVLKLEMFFKKNYTRLLQLTLHNIHGVKIIIKQK